MFAKLIETLKANPRTLVFTEGSDARILEATARLKKDGFLTPILVGVETEVKAAAEKGGFDIEGVRIVDPATYAGMDAMVEKMVELRKGKMTAYLKCHYPCEYMAALLSSVLGQTGTGDGGLGRDRFHLSSAGILGERLGKGTAFRRSEAVGIHGLS